VRILAIDPGTTQSGWVVYDSELNTVEDAGHDDNYEMLHMIKWKCTPCLAIEMIACYGMPVGASTFETCVWIGRFWQKFQESDYSRLDLVYRKDVKLHLCGSLQAKDGNVRQALLDKFEPSGGGATPQIGTKPKQGPLYAVRGHDGHAWAALAVAVTFAEKEAAEVIEEPPF